MDMLNFIISLLRKDFSFFSFETKVDENLRKKLINSIHKEKENGL